MPRRSEPQALPAPVLLDGGWYLPLTGGRVDLDAAMLHLAATLPGLTESDDPVAEASLAEVRYVRRFPWCTCGDGHGFHLEGAEPGSPGAFPALVHWGW